MGAETRTSVAPGAKRPLHRQYLPLPPEFGRAGRQTELQGGLFPGEPETCRRALRPFLRNFLYLILLLAVFKVYRIEERAYQGRAFQMLVTVALLALPLHYLAPFRWKKPVFIAASMIGLFWVFGAAVGATVLAFAAVLIGTCLLPIPWAGRAAILAALAVGLAWRGPRRRA